MHKVRTAAVLLAAFGSLGLLGAGTAHAGQGGGKGDEFNIQQSTTCRSHDLNLDVLGEVGILNGLGGNLLNGEGNAGAQQSSLGSSMGCSNSFK
ncbi:hypothetical protein BIV25_23220 [Streptomyces sp. MUSC 14]|jgi:hypothetical protein|uniref:hypothetical protein n=1 Tax=Streptomyces TaxID=1883 RepID=UPI0008F5BDAE|nr:hypothetical protein [Streptomyces sp. MUSC 14]OIJ94192.1 hypothetical protein BIV25_23220 [Streptomyces sp. MUSC 14]